MLKDLARWVRRSTKERANGKQSSPRREDYSPGRRKGLHWLAQIRTFAISQREEFESVRRWWDYTAAYQRMIEATHTPEAPWHIVPADDKRRARLNLIRHLLDSIPYEKVDMSPAKNPQGEAAAQECSRGAELGPADPQSLLRPRRVGSARLG